MSTLLDRRENSTTYHNNVMQDAMQWLINWVKKYVQTWGLDKLANL